MEFEEYANMVDFPKQFETTIAYKCIHPHTLPRKLITLGIFEFGMYKMPSSVNNYTTVDGIRLLNPITIPVISFKEDLFKNNQTISELVLSTHLDTLPKECFMGMKNLKSIWIPRRLKNILKDCFKDCNNLTDIYYEGSEEEYKEIEVYCKRFKVIPKLGINDLIEESHDLGNLPFLRAQIHYDVKLDLPPVKEYKFIINIKEKGEEK